MTTTQKLNPWFSMWLKPRETIQSIVDRNPEHLVIGLAAMSGISQALDRASIKNAGDSLSLPMLLSIAIAAGAITGIIGLYIFGYLLKLSGKWLGGAGNSINVRAAIAWSSVPIIWALLLWLPELHLFGIDLFRSSAPSIEARPFTYLSFLAVEMVIAIWALVAFLKCVGQVHGFSAWRALGATLLAIAMIAVPIVLFVLMLISLK